MHIGKSLEHILSVAHSPELLLYTVSILLLTRCFHPTFYAVDVHCRPIVFCKGWIQQTRRSAETVRDNSVPPSSPLTDHVCSLEDPSVHPPSFFGRSCLMIITEFVYVCSINIDGPVCTCRYYQSVGVVGEGSTAAQASLKALCPLGVALALLSVALYHCHSIIFKSYRWR